MGLGDFVSGIFGSKNKDAESIDPYKTDPNAYQYGGHAGGAQAQANIYGGVANNYTQGAYGNFTTAQDMLGAQNAARGQQQDALGLAAQRAHGQNLISSQITAQQQQQAAAQQAGMAASARGPAALAMAQQNQAANTGQATASLGAQGAIAGAQEQLANQQAYLQGASGIRGQDIGAAGTAGSIGAAQGGLGLGYAGLENNVNDAQLTAQMNGQAQNSANYNAAHGIQAGASGQNAAINQQNALGLVGAGSSLAGKVMGAATGGHIHGGAPYLVGERGPELVLPNKDGFVMTAAQTAALRGVPPTTQQVTAMPSLARYAGGPLMGARAKGGVMTAHPSSPRFSDSTVAAPVFVPGATQAPSQSYGAIGAPSMAPVTFGPGLSTPEQQELADRQQLSDRAQYDIERPYGGELTGMIDKRNRDTVATAEKQRALGLAPQERSLADIAAAPKEDRGRLEAENREAVEAGAMERKARYGLGQGKKAEAKQQKQAETTAKGDAKAYEKGRGIGDMLSNMASSVDVGYHGAPAAAAAPSLLALPGYSPRAEGGPIDPNNPDGDYALKGGGIDVGQTFANMNQHTIDANNHPGSSGGSMPSTNLASAAAGSFGGLAEIAKGIDTSYHPVEAREDGGPLSAIQSIGAHIASLIEERRRARDAESVAAQAAESARSRPAAVASSRTAGEIYRAPDAPSSAPSGSGPVTGTMKAVPTGPEGVMLPDYRTAAPDAKARAYGGPIKAKKKRRAK